MSPLTGTIQWGKCTREVSTGAWDHPGTSWSRTPQAGVKSTRQKVVGTAGRWHTQGHRSSKLRCLEYRPVGGKGQRGKGRPITFRSFFLLGRFATEPFYFLFFIFGC